MKVRLQRRQSGCLSLRGPLAERGQIQLEVCHGESNTMKMEMPQPAVYLAQPAAHTDTE